MRIQEPAASERVLYRIAVAALIKSNIELNRNSFAGVPVDQREVQAEALGVSQVVAGDVVVPFLGPEPDLAVVGASDEGLDTGGIGRVVYRERFAADTMGYTAERWLVWIGMLSCLTVLRVIGEAEPIYPLS